MAHKVVGVRVDKARQFSPGLKPATSPKLARLLKDYETATEQYGVIVRYLRGAIEVLPKAECELLMEFAEIAKKHCEQMHRKIEREFGIYRRSA